MIDIDVDELDRQIESSVRAAIIVIAVGLFSLLLGVMVALSMRISTL